MLQHADGANNTGGFAADMAGDGVGGGQDGGGGGGGVVDLAGLRPPPDKGCPCVVLRTGFETSQGQLMKTILFSTKRVAAGSDWETGVFIFILLVFAAVASSFVLAEVRNSAAGGWMGRGAHGIHIETYIFCSVFYLLVILGRLL